MIVAFTTIPRAVLILDGHLTLDLGSVSRRTIASLPPYVEEPAQSVLREAHHVRHRILFCIPLRSRLVWFAHADHCSACKPICKPIPLKQQGRRWPCCRGTHRRCRVTPPPRKAVAVLLQPWISRAANGLWPAG